MRIAIPLLIAALLCRAAAAGAQDGAALPATAADYLERATAQGSWSQVSAAYLSQNAASQTRYPATPEADSATRLPLGDASVALTGLLLGDLASSGRVRLDDPISRYLPEGFACADARVCAIGLQELAMQTSGLPPLPTNLFPSSPADPWRDYREADLLAFLANYRLPAQPLPRESPLGNLLLAWLLGRAHGDGYAAALRERVANPLALHDTGVDGDSGPGALPTRVHSSPEDLTRLLRAMLRPGESPLRAALMLSRQPRDGRANWGLGWRITTVRADEQEWPLVWQSAQLDGDAVFVGFRTDQQQAVALSAKGAASLAPLGLALLKAGALPPLPPASVSVSFDPAEFAGLYEFTPGAQLVIRSSASGLSAQISGRLALRLTPLAPDLFAVDGAAIRLSFQRDARGRVDALRWSENGVIVPVRRLSTRAPALPRSEVTLTAERRRDYCGDFAVDADVIARLSCGDRLTLQFSGAQARELFAYADDRFASRDGELELVVRRASDGRVAALTVNLLGNETTLERVDWAALSPAVTAALADERRARDAAKAADRNSAAAAQVSDAAAPWVAALPVLSPTTTRPYLSPGGTARAAVSTTAATSARAIPAADIADTPRAGKPANVRPAPASPPARVEALPERFERPRFAPRADEKPKDSSHDGT